MSLAQILIYLFLLYLAIGLLFGLVFVSKGVDKIDPAAKGTTWGFRLLILPGCLAFWPFLMKKWIENK